MITVESSEVGVDGNPHIRVGKLNLVDLAGSERQAKTGSTVRENRTGERSTSGIDDVGRTIQRGDQYQSLTVRARQCHIGAGRWQFTHTVS